MKECDAAIDACIRERTGLVSAGEYFALCGGAARVDVFNPALPKGMMDAAEFRGMMLRQQTDEADDSEHEQAGVNRRWVLLTQVILVDGPGFKAALSPLLQRKARVLFEHRMLLAERIMQAKQGGAEHVAWINAGALQLQATIANLAQRRGPSMSNDGALQRTIRQAMLQDGALSAYFPCLFADIPEDLDSMAQVSAFLAELSSGVERDRVAATRRKEERAARSRKEEINAAAVRVQSTIMRVQMCLPSLQIGAASTHLLPLRHNKDLHALFPSLLERIPESFHATGSISQFLVLLSGAVEQDRIKASAWEEEEG